MIPRLHRLLALALAGCSPVASTPASPRSANTPSDPTPSRSRPERGTAAELTRAHNDVRAKVGVGPLRWSAPLARHAQQWADHLAQKGCALEHRRTDAYGENIFWSSAPSSATEVVAEWAAEASNYDHRKNSCKGTCGHYTQVVWAESRSFGCGSARCGEAELWVCNYDPPGNVVGQSPY